LSPFRCRAAAVFHLVIKAGALLADIPRENPLAGRDSERFMDDVEYRVYTLVPEKRTVVFRPVGKPRACAEYPRVFLSRDFYIGVGFRVF
jgi:hypothetical protein